ncbi:MAG: methyltransferase domain-containing protein [Bacteriovoracaceae bacterium]|nr:methyltransferase domain-containing protein [Bacteriovoracaceae bacterium]
MDPITLKAYSDNSDRLIKSYTTMKPRRLYELIATFFHRQASTLDVGCGSGRDLAFLQGSGFKIEGLDAVPEFIAHIKESTPSIPAHLDQLPKLQGMKDNTFDNVLVSAVLMHLPASELIEAVINLLRLTKPGGRLIVSTKKRSMNAPERDDWGRLHTQIMAPKLTLLFEGLGAKTLFHEEQVDNMRANVSWDNFVFEKRDLTKRTGIESLQEIITKDKKDTSYKLALLRALCQMSRYEPAAAFSDLGSDHVWLPLKRVAFYWLKFYMPLTGLRQSKTHEFLAFQKDLMNLGYTQAELGRLVNEYDESINRDTIDPVLKKISDTIIQGPLKYIGDSEYGVFNYLTGKKAKESPGFKFDFEMGMMQVPTEIWHDLILFGSWIEDSVVMRWAEFTEKYNAEASFADIYKLLTTPTFDDRTTQDIRKLFQGQTIECVWSGNQTNDFHIDHAIPYSFWKNNDLWNLLPASAKINSAKSDSIPHPELVTKRKDCLIHYWDIYSKAYPERFKYQLQKSHRINGSNWENELFLSFLETVTRLSYQKVVGVWELGDK